MYCGRCEQRAMMFGVVSFFLLLLPLSGYSASTDGCSCEDCTNSSVSVPCNSSSFLLEDLNITKPCNNTSYGICNGSVCIASFSVDIHVEDQIGEKYNCSVVTPDWVPDCLLLSITTWHQVSESGSGNVVQSSLLSSAAFSTSDAGPYQCQIDVALQNSSFSLSLDMIVNISLKIPPPQVNISEVVGVGTSGNGSLKCVVTMDDRVSQSTLLFVTGVWRTMEMNFTFEQEGFAGPMIFFLNVSISGSETITCEASVSSNSSFLNASDPGSASIDLVVPDVPTTVFPTSPTTSSEAPTTQITSVPPGTSPTTSFSSTAPPSTASSQTTTGATESTPNIGGIVGGVIGALVAVLLILIIVAVILLWQCYIKSESISIGPAKQVEMTDKPNGCISEEALSRLKTIPMEEFTAHVELLHSEENWRLEDEYQSIGTKPLAPYLDAKLPCNMPKNRFDNVLPYDSSRVKLMEIKGAEGSDYINASYLDGYGKPNAYIATQGPLKHTICDFWRMVWELNLQTVVMLTETVEAGRLKCERYWPERIDEGYNVGYNLVVTLVEQRPYAEYKVKLLTITDVSDPNAPVRTITHYHFTSWPDHGVPEDKTCLIQFIKRVRKSHPYSNPVLLVHCSAGVGRTGTFMTLDSMMERLKAQGNLNVYEFVCNLRKKRVLMVQTEAQYTFIHDALEEYITCGDTSVAVSTMHSSISHLYKSDSGQTGFERQFSLLDQVSYKPNETNCSEGLEFFNVEKNRYPDLVPYDTTRVRLKAAACEGGDYINASFVDGYKHRRAFLATQAPLESTVNDFWRMIWEHKSRAIVMLCNTTENGKEICPSYWPTEVNDSAAYGKLKVKLISEELESDLTIRKFEIGADSPYLVPGLPDGTVVTQFHHTHWPEDGIAATSSVLKLLNLLVKVQISSGNSSITVMCNDGVGRTGSFICVYSQLERIKTEGIADVFQFIKGSRIQRPRLVRNLEHYIFCHEVLADYLDTFDNYANFKDLK